MASVPVYGSPSILPAANFDAVGDAKTLRKAMKGMGTDEAALIDVLARRSNAQRQEIKRRFSEEFGRVLVNNLKSELGGKLKKVFVGLMMTPAEYDAYWLNKAMKGVGTNESLLIEILCTRSSGEIDAARKAYAHEYKSDLVNDIEGEVRGDFEKLLVALVKVKRPADARVSREAAHVDAQTLHKAGEKKFLGTDEDRFIEIFTQRSRAHLKVVFEEYATISDYDIERSIDREMSGDLEKALVAIVNWVRGPGDFFAEKLYKSMDGLGTNDDMLTRVLISRSEVDLRTIATAFNENHKKYKKTLTNWIKDDVGGDYEKVLLEILQ